MSEEVTYEHVWDTLHRIDVSNHVQEKNNLTYLSWNWAWQVMMENFPQTTYFFKPNTITVGADDEVTVTVNCVVKIGDLSREMWLPVMTGFTNKAKHAPNAREIGDTRMRCLVKAFSMFGLASYLYAGEDLPTENERSRVKRHEETKKVVAKKKAATKAKEEPNLRSAPTDASESKMASEPSESNEPGDPKEPKVVSEPEPETEPQDVSEPTDAAVAPETLAFAGDPNGAVEDVRRAAQEFFSVFLDGCDNIDSLREFWQKNASTLTDLEQNDNDRYSEILTEFQSKKSEIASNSKE